MSSSIANNNSTTTPDTTTVDADTFHPRSSSNSNPLPLPAPCKTEATQKLDLSTSESQVALDELGPLVVNQDGTLSRIANWKNMAEIERQNTLRVLGKRNQLRMEAVRKEQRKGGGEGEGEGGKGEGHE